MNRWNALGEHGAGSTCRSASCKVGSTAGTVSVEEVRGIEGEGRSHGREEWLPEEKRRREANLQRGQSSCAYIARLRWGAARNHDEAADQGGDARAPGYLHDLAWSQGMCVRRRRGGEGVQ